MIDLGTSNYAITNEKCQKIVDNLKKVTYILSLNAVYSATPTTRAATPSRPANTTSAAPRKLALHEHIHASENVSEIFSFNLNNT